MSKHKPYTTPGSTTTSSDDPVELSNLDPDAVEKAGDKVVVEGTVVNREEEQAQLAALRTLADERAARIVQLEKDRDKLVAETSGKAPLKTTLAKIVKIDIVTAPEHYVAVHVVPTDGEMQPLKVALERLMSSHAADSPDGVSSDDLAEQIHQSLETAPHSRRNGPPTDPLSYHKPKQRNDQLRADPLGYDQRRSNQQRADAQRNEPNRPDLRTDQQRSEQERSDAKLNEQRENDQRDDERTGSEMRPPPGQTTIDPSTSPGDTLTAPLTPSFQDVKPEPSPNVQRGF